MTETDGLREKHVPTPQENSSHPCRKNLCLQKWLICLVEIVFSCFCLAWFFALCLKFWPYTMDDAYITFRYARNFADGVGLVFNTGEMPRAEGVTSPIYALLLGLFLPVAHMPFMAKLLGLLSIPVSSFFIGLVVWKIATQWTNWHPLALAGLSCVAGGYYLCNAYVVGNASDGMETAFSCLTVAVFWWVFLHVCVKGTHLTGQDTVALGMAGVAVPLFRPEMALMSTMALLGGLWIGQADIRRKMLGAFVVFICVGAIYFCIRAIYYHNFLPLPFYIKQGRLGLFGWSELEDFVFSNGVLLWLSVASAILALAKASNETEPQGLGRFVAVMAISSWVQIGYYGTIRHIMGFGLRYFQPVFVGIVILAFAGIALALRTINRPEIRSRLSVPGIVVLLVGVLWTGNVNAYWRAERELVSGYAGVGRTQNPASWDDVRNVSREFHLKVAMNDCGKFPFYSELQIVDLAGLNQREIARDFTRKTTMDILRKETPDLVILCGNDKHNIFDLKAYEAINSNDVLTLGYRHQGSIYRGDTYHWLVFANDRPDTKQYLDKLNAIGFFEFTP